MSVVIDGTSGVTTPGVVNTAGETIATTLAVTGASTLTGQVTATNGVAVAAGLATGTGIGAAGAGNDLRLYVNGTQSATITTAGLLQFNSGYGSVATAYGCRAWVNFNGTGTVAIRSSGNVSSITDVATGFFTINLTTAMPDINYSVHAGVGAGSSAARLLASSAVIVPTTTSFQIQTTNFAGADTDSAYTYAAVFR